MATIAVEEGQCQIFPTQQVQLCRRVRVTVAAMVPDANDPNVWITDPGDELLVDQELLCSQRGLTRLLKKIDQGVSVPPKQTKKPAEPLARQAKTEDAT